MADPRPVSLPRVPASPRPTLVAAVPAEQCTPELQEVLRTAARAALAAYAPQSIGAGERRHRHARRSA